MLLYKEGAVSTRIATTYVTGYPLPGIGGTTPIRRGAEYRVCVGIIGDPSHPLLWAWLPTGMTRSNVAVRQDIVDPPSMADDPEKMRRKYGELLLGAILVDVLMAEEKEAEDLGITVDELMVRRRAARAELE